MLGKTYKPNRHNYDKEKSKQINKRILQNNFQFSFCIFKKIFRSLHSFFKNR
jgi:hypothetical protein